MREVAARRESSPKLSPCLREIEPGSDVMKRIAAPMIGGIFTSFLLELLVYPGIYQIWKGRGVER